MFALKNCDRTNCALFTGMPSILRPLLERNYVMYWNTGVPVFSK